jgi:hypothetical protein
MLRKVALEGHPPLPDIQRTTVPHGGRTKPPRLRPTPLTACAPDRGHGQVSMLRIQGFASPQGLTNILFGNGEGLWGHANTTDQPSPRHASVSKPVPLPCIHPQNLHRSHLPVNGAVFQPRLTQCPMQSPKTRQKAVFGLLSGVGHPSRHPGVVWVLLAAQKITKINNTNRLLFVIITLP